MSQKKHHTTRSFVEFIKASLFEPMTLSRFQKDRMEGIAPEPIAKFGNRDLWLEEQAGPYVEKLLNTPPRRRQGSPPAESKAA